jgi:hypothetical protein
MSIKPIDMQVSIGQIHEVAKSEQARSTAASVLQQSLDGEAGKKSREVPTRVEENKKTEHAIITNEEKERGGRGGGKREKGSRGKDQHGAAKDERMGLFIDILK